MSERSSLDWPTWSTSFRNVATRTSTESWMIWSSAREITGACIRSPWESIRWNAGWKNGKSRSNNDKNSIETCTKPMRLPEIRTWRSPTFERKRDSSLFPSVLLHYNCCSNCLAASRKRPHRKLGPTLWSKRLLKSSAFSTIRSRRCIINSINDPNVFIMDHLLLLEPVKILEGENIHNVDLRQQQQQEEDRCLSSFSYWTSSFPVV